MGITQSVYDSWRKSKGLPAQDVRNITIQEVQTIYKEKYWTPLRCDELPKPLDLVVFDSGVNCGIGRAAKWLNTALNLSPSSKVTDRTVTMTKKTNPLSIAGKVISLREAHYRNIARRNPKLKVFLKGWLNRLNDLRRTIAP